MSVKNITSDICNIKSSSGCNSQNSDRVSPSEIPKLDPKCIQADNSDEASMCDSVSLNMNECVISSDSSEDEYYDAHDAAVYNTPLDFVGSGLSEATKHYDAHDAAVVNIPLDLVSSGLSEVTKGDLSVHSDSVSTNTEEEQEYHILQNTVHSDSIKKIIYSG